MNGNPEACDKLRLLKQEYESALREEALYEYGTRLRSQGPYDTKVWQ
jgi:hypothetical protein